MEFRISEPLCKGKASQCGTLSASFYSVVEAGIETARRRTIISHRARMKKISSIFLAGFLAFVCSGQLAAQSDDPSEIFLRAYMTSQQAEKLEHENQPQAALAKYRIAGSRSTICTSVTLIGSRPSSNIEAAR